MSSQWGIYLKNLSGHKKEWHDITYWIVLYDNKITSKILVDFNLTETKSLLVSRNVNNHITSLHRTA